jgi:hypothetical protein
MSDVLDTPPHEALDGNDRVFRVDRLILLRVVANLSCAIGVVTHDGRQQRATMLVVQADGNATAHRGNEELVVPRSMPMASLCSCGAADSPGSAI